MDNNDRFPLTEEGQPLRLTGKRKPQVRENWSVKAVDRPQGIVEIGPRKFLIHPSATTNLYVIVSRMCKA
jgi:hypothetical protein